MKKGRGSAELKDDKGDTSSFWSVSLTAYKKQPIAKAEMGRALVRTHNTGCHISVVLGFKRGTKRKA